MPPLSLSSHLVLLVLFVLWNLSECCFITNCPVGGRKRSSSGVTGGLAVTHKQCPLCGPFGSNGRCFGPSMCCVPGQGCFIGKLPECTREDSSPLPCRNAAPSCQAVPQGQCVLEGYCCNDRGECKADYWGCSPAKMAEAPKPASAPVAPSRRDLLDIVASARSPISGKLSTRRKWKWKGEQERNQPNHEEDEEDMELFQ